MSNVDYGSLAGYLDPSGGGNVDAYLAAIAAQQQQEAGRRYLDAIYGAGYHTGPDGQLVGPGIDNSTPDYGGAGGDYSSADLGGGGGGGGAPAAPTYDPSTDPAFQNLLNQLGLKETLARTQAQSSISRAQAQEAPLEAQVHQAGTEQRLGLNNSFEGRGAFRSGARLHALDVQRQQEGNRIGNLQTGLANRVADINSSLDQNVSDLAMQRANAVFSAKMAAGK